MSLVRLFCSFIQSTCCGPFCLLPTVFPFSDLRGLFSGSACLLPLSNFCVCCVCVCVLFVCCVKVGDTHPPIDRPLTFWTYMPICRWSITSPVIVERKQTPSAFHCLPCLS
ncbi:hypothetical protein B0T19DRAFT_233747 [Cercophora scortea]|uniref:Secreted protein n=1 Tax=Cercophora scortea TaxID=314031 RepID=A0AAE0M9Q1_9PEZI|nr:hypothetical protein B0T19DRAFT_233747 [Cercophora scortea]